MLLILSIACIVTTLLTKFLKKTKGCHWSPFGQATCTRRCREPLQPCHVLPALDYLLASSASPATVYALQGEFTLRRTIILSVLVVQMHLIPSLTTMSVPDCTTSFWTRHDGATKKLPVTPLHLPGVPAKPSVWHCGSRLP